jgi:hypothetical protein
MGRSSPSRGQHITQPKCTAPTVESPCSFRSGPIPALQGMAQNTTNVCASRYTQSSWLPYSPRSPRSSRCGSPAGLRRPVSRSMRRLRTPPSPSSPRTHEGTEGASRSPPSGARHLALCVPDYSAVSAGGRGAPSLHRQRRPILEESQVRNESGWTKCEASAQRGRAGAFPYQAGGRFALRVNWQTIIRSNGGGRRSSGFHPQHFRKQ